MNWLFRLIIVVGVSIALALNVQAQKHRPEFVIPRDAKSLKIQNDKSDRNDREETRFSLVKSYPASDYLESISKKLDKLGWSKTSGYVWPLPEGESPPVMWKWEKVAYSTKNDSGFFHLWTGTWKNKSGDILVYHLYYQNPEKVKPDLDNLTVDIAYYSNHDYQRMVREALGNHR